MLLMSRLLAREYVDRHCTTYGALDTPATSTRRVRLSASRISPLVPYCRVATCQRVELGTRNVGKLLGGRDETPAHRRERLGR